MSKKNYEEIEEVKVEDVTDTDVIEEVECEVVDEDTTSTYSDTDGEDATTTIRNIMSFISSGLFNAHVKEESERTGKPEKQIAKSFFGRFLGTVSDVLHIVLGTVEEVAVTILKVLSFVLESGIRIICKIARRLASIFTLNMTCVQ